MQLKVCGIINAETITALSSMKISRLGFIFYHKSPRYVYGKLIEHALNGVPERIKKTGVFVNAGIAEIDQIIDRYKLDSIQLHGDESPDFCRHFNSKTEVIKTISIHDKGSFDAAKLYLEACDLFLFDTQSKHYGGNGKAFNWQWLDAYTLNKPFYLSGGISLENYAEIKNISHEQLVGIDINSRFETAPGIKDIEKIKQLIRRMNETKI